MNFKFVWKFIKILQFSNKFKIHSSTILIGIKTNFTRNLWRKKKIILQNKLFLKEKNILQNKYAFKEKIFYKIKYLLKDKNILQNKLFFKGKNYFSK